MPAVSERQRRFLGADLARKRAGKKTRTGMSEEQLSHYAKKPKSKMPKGASMSPSGDIGYMRQMEAKKLGTFKNVPTNYHTPFATTLKGVVGGK